MARVKNTRQMMEVMQAYLDGKKIEFANVNYNRSDNGWYEVASPSWNWEQYDYRVKQEPREFSVVLDRDGKAIGVGDASAASIIVVPSGKVRDAKVIKVREVL